MYELELLGLLYEELEEGRFDELEPFRDSISEKIKIKSKIFIFLRKTNLCDLYNINLKKQ